MLEADGTLTETEDAETEPELFVFEMEIKRVLSQTPGFGRENQC